MGVDRYLEAQFDGGRTEIKRLRGLLREGIARLSFYAEEGYLDLDAAPRSREWLKKARAELGKKP